MDGFLDLLRDNSSVLGRLVSTAVPVAAAVPLGAVLGGVAARRGSDPYARYYLRKAARYAVLVAVLVVPAMPWRPFAGRIGVVLGLGAAGVAFAMQEAIGALAGWVSILSSRQLGVGDRVQTGGVQGDVLDITPLRTKLLEIGSADGRESWVRARQYTGRLVSVSNKAVFNEPVYNSSAAFDYLWEELTLPVPYREDWQRAERILQEEVERASASSGAQQAMIAMRRRYPVRRADVEPRVFVRATDDWVELSARFVVPVRDARRVKDTMTRRVLDRFAEAGLSVASSRRTSPCTVPRRADVFYDDWQGLVRVVVVGSCAYGALIVLLRVSGKRTLAKLNAFDFVVTVSLGSTLATVLLSSSVALAEGITALALLAGLQYLVAWASTRSRRVERLVKSEPALVYRDQFLPDAMRRERVTSDELRQAARAQGHADLREVAAIVLENDGTLSILTASPPGLTGAAPRVDPLASESRQAQ